MSGFNRVSGSGDAGRLTGRSQAAPTGGAGEPAPGFAPDGLRLSVPRVRVGPPLNTKPDGKIWAMIAGGAVLGIAAAALLVSAYLSAPLLGAATLYLAPLLGALAIPLFGMGLAKLFGKREAAKVGAE